MKLIAILFGAIFVNNFVLTRFLGICPFIGVSRRSKPALSMGIAVMFVMLIATIITWPLTYFVLNPYNVEYLQTVVFILVIAAAVQLIEQWMQKKHPELHKTLGIYLPLITTNCAILGVALLNITKSYNFIESIVHSIGAGIGFILALFLMSGIRERLQISNIPEAFQGVPIAFIVAGFMALAFMGLAGIV